MFIQVTGKNEAISAAELKTAAFFYGNCLLNKRLLNNIELEIVCERNGSKGANCIWVSENHRPRDFEIILDTSMGKRKQLISLAHEMVHLKQFAMGEMKDYVGPKFRQFTLWKNKKLPSDTFYWEMPWEIEAYGRELGLYEMYKVYKDIHKGKKK